MKILVITGSAHKHGTTALLAEKFVNGAEEAGHQAARFDAAFKKIHPCIACERCHMTGAGCVFKDDMEELNLQLLEAEAVIFISPIYYYGLNAQIKTVIDRFYANDGRLHGNKKAALIVTMSDETIESAEGAITSFKGMTGYLGWNIAGIIAGVACGDVDALNKTDYPEQAYELGKNL